MKSVTACSPQNDSIKIYPRIVLIAAGAIESTRILLLMDYQNNNQAFKEEDAVGRFFYDHLSVPVAQLKVRNRDALNRLVGFRFEKGGVMRNLRFELSSRSQMRKKVAPCFAHIAFETTSQGGFDALRDLFRALQQRKLPSLKIIMQLMMSTPWLARAMWWRIIEKRLLYPRDAQIQVHMVIEQEPIPENRITLSTTERDIYGQPLAQIDWRVTQRDMDNLSLATSVFEGPGIPQVFLILPNL
jgi:hypothetical protein